MRLRWTDLETDLRALVVLGTGGTRALTPAGITGEKDEKAVNGGLARIVRDLSLRTGALGMDLGVAALSIYGVPEDMPRETALRALGRAVEWLDGRVLAIPGPTLAPDELEILLDHTEHVAGLPLDQGGSGDPSPWTALGAFSAIRACVEDLEGRVVAVLGAGRVGSLLVGDLVEAGARVLLADTDQERAAVVAATSGATVLSPTELLTAECDVLSPNARGPVFTDETIPALRCRFVAGAANGQLGEMRHAERLKDRGIVVVPEQVAGSGWLLNLATELIPGGYRRDLARVRVIRIEDSAAEVLRIAAEEDVTTVKAAELLGDRWRASG